MDQINKTRPLSLRTSLRNTHNSIKYFEFSSYIKTALCEVSITQFKVDTENSVPFTLYEKLTLYKDDLLFGLVLARL
jgi:hypothetical protein